MAEGAINNPREAIDAIDGEILRLLNERAEIALKVGAAKQVADTSLCDPVRENAVLERLIAENPGPFDARAISGIFQRIIDESLHLQQAHYHTQSTEGEIVSLVVRLKDRPGALHSALRPFVRRNINLVKIESHPIAEDPLQVEFYLDVQVPASESELRGAVDEIKEQAESVEFPD